MPDPVIVGASDGADLANADAAAEAMLRQSRSPGSASIKPDISPQRSNDLDAEFEKISGQKLDGSAPNPTKEELEHGRENGGVKQRMQGEPTAEELQAEADKQAAADQKAADATKAAEVAEADKAAKAAAKKDGPKGLLDDVLGDETVAEKKDDPSKAYEEIKLRSDASDATRTSFEKQRALAIQRETAVSEKLAAEQAKRLELEGQITELQKTSNKVTPEIEAELKELREFRAVHDVASRPEFKAQFDTRITANDTAMYDFFKAQKMPDDRIAALKALSEDQRVEYIETHVLPKLSPVQRRMVESKLIDNVAAVNDRSKALDAAKVDADKILAAQREAPRVALIARDNEVINRVKVVLPNLPYMHVQEIPSTATDIEKAQIEARNKFALELQGNLKQAIIDDSPSVRAEAAIAIPIARYLSRELKMATARMEAAEAKLAAITKAGATGRLGRSAALPGAGPTPAPKTTASSSDSIDDLFKAAGGVL